MPEDKEERLSVRAIYKNWQKTLKPKTPRPPTTWPNRKMPAEPVVEPWAQPSAGKPSAEAMEARQRAEAEAEAAQLAAADTPAGFITFDPARHTLDDLVQHREAEAAALQAELAAARTRIAELEARAESGPRETDSAADFVTIIRRALDAANVWSNWPPDISAAKMKKVQKALVYIRGGLAILNEIRAPSTAKK